MRVAIGPLARTGLESRAGADLGASVRAALLYYARKLESGRVPAKYPDFLPTPTPARDSAESSVEVEVVVEVDKKLEAELTQEAAQQEISVSELARHAVLLYLAEIDLVAGRSAAAQNRSRAVNSRQD